MTDLIQIDKISELIKYKFFIDSLYKHYGKIHFHSFESIESSLKQNKNLGFYVFLDKGNFIISAFERKTDDIWQCYFQGYPFLTKSVDMDQLFKYIQEVQKALKARTLYFPLVYNKKETFGILGKNKKFHTYKRLPSSIIEKPISSKIIWDRVLERYGSRANKQRKRFENELRIQKYSGVDVGSQLSLVELNSWKYKCRQDMLSRGNQIEYYSELVKSGFADITFAVDKKGNPIAFRIDVKMNNTIYVLKWSYDDRFKKLSPGFYLLTIDLFKSYPTDSYRYVDLYGSPDKLKSLLETGRISRYDVIYSNSTEDVNQIKKNRLSFDKKININFNKNKSIRSVFELDGV